MFQNPSIQGQGGALPSSFLNLSKQDLATLRKFARFKMRGLRGRVHDADANDLLHEAVSRVLDGRRKLPEQPDDIVNYLKWIMRSIADEWLKRGNRYVPLLQDQPAETKEPDGADVQKAYETVKGLLRGDAVGEQVFEALWNGQKSAEVQKTLGVSVNIYRAAKKRISRRVAHYARQTFGDTGAPATDLAA